MKKIKERHPEIVLNIILKDYRNNIAELQRDVENFILSIPEYTKEVLEVELND